MAKDFTWYKPLTNCNVLILTSSKRRGEPAFEKAAKEFAAKLQKEMLTEGDAIEFYWELPEHKQINGDD